MTFLKQFAWLPGIAWEDMKTMLIKSTGHTAFVRTQLPPELTPEMLIGCGGPVMPSFVWRGTRSAQVSRHPMQCSALPRLPLPRASESLAERAVFGLLAFSATVCLGQALAMVIEMPSNWPMLSAWVGRSLG